MVGEGIDPVRTIEAKRDGVELSPEALGAFVSGYLAGDIAEAQMAAFLMAGVLRGFSAAEAAALTDVFVASGDTVDLSTLSGPTVDKHSTGGVGDSTTLIVAPIAAACGLQVAKLSGRGLGHTGGTLDKLEAIPGFRVDLAPDELAVQVERIGLAVAAATGDLVPADKRIYALRDVTATVDSVGLIASSVMSKKLAGGAANILLDVKAGDGAFMPDAASATALAELCVEIGRARGRATAALVTDMDQPLGDAVGNALDVAEAIEVLRGERGGRLRDLAVELAVGLLVLSGRSEAAARDLAASALASGAALERFREMVVGQGGDPSVADDPWSVLPRASVIQEWKGLEGTVEGVACKAFGVLAGRLGAGRLVPGASVDASVGLEVLVRTGDTVRADTPLVRVHARSARDAESVMDALPDLVRVGPGPASPPGLVLARVGL